MHVCTLMYLGRFGTFRTDFSSYEISLLTNFMMMFGEFPEDWCVRVCMCMCVRVLLCVCVCVEI